MVSESNAVQLHLTQVDRCLELAHGSEEADVKRTYLACAKVWLALAQEVQSGREFARLNNPQLTAAE